MTASRNATRTLALVWVAFTIVAILSLAFGNLMVYGVGVPVAALALAIVCARLGLFQGAGVSLARWTVDKADLVAVAVFYAAVVGLFKLAFGVFGTGNLLWFFLSFATALVIGVVGPIAYTVVVRHRTLASLGIGVHNLRSTMILAVVFAAAQFAVTLWGIRLPQPEDWIPLLTMAITVGVFEAVFFRGFIQGTLEPGLGVAPALAIAAALYALYHVGYGMGASDMLFLFGLGVVYTLAFRITGNVLAIWPLLTPLGSFFEQLRSGDLAGQLPWASMLGFGDVLGVMAIAIWLGARYQRRHPAREVEHRAGSRKLGSVRP